MIGVTIAVVDVEYAVVYVIVIGYVIVAASCDVAGNFVADEYDDDVVVVAGCIVICCDGRGVVGWCCCHCCRRYIGYCSLVRLVTTELRLLCMLSVLGMLLVVQLLALTVVFDAVVCCDVCIRCR